MYGKEAKPDKSLAPLDWFEQHFGGHKPSSMRYTAATTDWSHKERATKEHIKYLSTQQTMEPWPDQIQRTLLEPKWVSDGKREVPRGVTVRERGDGCRNPRHDAETTLASDEAPLPPTKRRRTIGPDADAGSLPQPVVETSMRLPFERNGRVDNSEVPRICSDDTEEDWGVTWQGPPPLRFKRRGVTHALGQAPRSDYEGLLKDLKLILHFANIDLPWSEIQAMAIKASDFWDSVSPLKASLDMHLQRLMTDGGPFGDFAATSKGMN